MIAKRLSLWLPPLVYMAVIFGFSAQSNPVPEVTAVVWDKLLHATEYGGLAFLLYRAFAGEGLGWLGALAAAVLAASLYGASDEWHQSFVPMRDSNIADWLADTIGASLGALAGSLVSAVRPSTADRR